MKEVKGARRQRRSAGRWRLVFAVSSLLCASIAAAQPSAGLPPEYGIRNGTFASGGGVNSAKCYTIVSTIGEAVVGRVSAETYTLTSGFPATIQSTGDTLFRDGFELNTGECTP